MLDGIDTVKHVAKDMDAPTPADLADRARIGRRAGAAWLNAAGGATLPTSRHGLIVSGMKPHPGDAALAHAFRDAHGASLREEIANALTHGIGAVVALGAGAVLITLTALWGDGWQLASAIVFSVALLLLYVASTLYHAITHPGAKARLKVFDHCAIYLLIAGTYTPFTLIGLRETWGWALFATIWALALAGIVFKLFYTGRFKLLSTIIYIAMGWLVVVAIGPLMRALDMWTLGWLFGGGVAYTAGTLFYMSRTIPYAHTIWHAFVLTGSICHFLAVASQVLP